MRRGQGNGAKLDDTPVWGHTNDRLVVSTQRGETLGLGTKGFRDSVELADRNGLSAMRGQKILGIRTEAR
jgi:hypothetical protein